MPEWHKSGHGLHAHFAVDRYVKRSLIVEAWGRGFVHIKLIGSPVGSGALGESRIAASYLSKYVAKSFLETQGRALGLHRYDVAQGFRPRVVALDGRSSGDVLEQASGLLVGELPSVEWSSSQSTDWADPPAVWAQWGR
ncbi:hypothetical protein [Leifsonia sp. 2MCAF36]|uniref:hypothetical protein n=1 Tax=Leifsonia sp. 2MCAF36 TaxID=3232988 RepID=UPI003F959165